MTLNTNVQTQVAALNQRVYRLASISMEAVERIATQVERELDALGASSKSLTKMELEVASKTGADPEDVALVKAKAENNRRVVAGIPADKLLMLRCLHGSDETTLANAWTALKSLTGKASKHA